MQYEIYLFKNPCFKKENNNLRDTSSAEYMKHPFDFIIAPLFNIQLKRSTKLVCWINLNKANTLALNEEKKANKD